LLIGRDTCGANEEFSSKNSAKSTKIGRELKQREDQGKARLQTFFVLDFGLDIVDGIAALDLEGDGLPC